MNVSDQAIVDRIQRLSAKIGVRTAVIQQSLMPGQPAQANVTTDEMAELLGAEQRALTRVAGGTRDD